ncbi:gamma carbonic anhydrase family protein [Candidatus Spongiihabitans sp.]|uniref:gamma carbonic anhydrase family protein n=1 Tax=Candidatus Spongiihabitans sp. TaxID=3101308 RepID=UPI003C7A651C
MIYALGDRIPEIAISSFVAPSADVIGLVRIGEQASVWFNAVLRGDNELIRIGNRSNVQDGSVLHTDPGLPLTIEDNVTIGHGSMLHGCHIKTGSLIGIGSVIMNKAIIGECCLVGANALVTENKAFPDRTLILGAPATVVRKLTDQEVADVKRAAEIYVSRIPQYKNLQHYSN